jgi:recombinational DNA repair protein RecT
VIVSADNVIASANNAIALTNNAIASTNNVIASTNNAIVSAGKNYSYFQLNISRSKGTAFLCPYDKCGSNT